MDIRYQLNKKEQVIFIIYMVLKSLTGMYFFWLVSAIGCFAIGFVLSTVLKIHLNLVVPPWFCMVILLILWIAWVFKENYVRFSAYRNWRVYLSQEGVVFENVFRISFEKEEFLHPISFCGLWIFRKKSYYVSNREASDYSVIPKRIFQNETDLKRVISCTGTVVTEGKEAIRYQFEFPVGLMDYAHFNRLAMEAKNGLPGEKKKQRSQAKSSLAIFGTLALLILYLIPIIPAWIVIILCTFFFALSVWGTNYVKPETDEKYFKLLQKNNVKQKMIGLWNITFYETHVAYNVNDQSFDFMWNAVEEIREYGDCWLFLLKGRGAIFHIPKGVVSQNETEEFNSYCAERTKIRHC